MKQYFISDTHFGHDKFHSENWEYKFWKKYNNINQDFILYHLGDLSFVHNHEYLKQIFSKFRENEHCKNIVLILGNHDDKASRYLQHGVVACDSMLITYKNKEKTVNKIGKKFLVLNIFTLPLQTYLLSFGVNALLIIYLFY